MIGVFDLERCLEGFELYCWKFFFVENHLDNSDTVVKKCSKFKQDRSLLLCFILNCKALGTIEVKVLIEIL